MTFLQRRPWMRVGIAILVLLALIAAGALLPMLRERFFVQDRVWARMKRTGTWRVGLDPSFPPFEQLDAKKHLVGFDVDLARAIASRWGMRVEFVSIGFDALVGAVRSGKIDAAISALPYDPLLTRDVRYSVPYFDAGWRVVVPATSSIQRLDDLRAGHLAVEWGSEGDVWARHLRDTHPGITLMLKASTEEVLAALRRGEADAGILDGVTARKQQSWLRSLPPPLNSEPYVIVMPYRAPVLQKEVNRALKFLRQEGTLAALEKRWLGPR